MEREELIEAARAAFVEAWEAKKEEIGRGIAASGTKSRAGITAALAVFEEAHTPSNDEREALARAIGDSEVDGRSSWGPDFADPSWEFMRDRDRAVADVVFVFHERVFEVRSEPQGEPSDAQVRWKHPEVVEAARLAYQEAYEADYDAEDCIVAALRAAGGVQ